MSERHFLYDIDEETKVRFVSFLGDTGRFDLAILTTDHYFGKKVILDIQTSRFAIIGSDDLEEPEYIEYAFNLNNERAEELKKFLYEIL